LYQSSKYNPVAFVDNSVELYRQSINGLEVFNEDDIEDLIQKHNIKEVLLAMPSITRIRRSEIISHLEPFSVVVRSLPSLTEIAQGKVSVNDLLEVDLRDLLGREPVKPNTQLLKTNITNKVVLVSGAGGSIGSELCRQIVSLKPKKLILFELSESSLYLINQELLNISIPNLEIVPVIGSVANRARIEYICNYYVVKTIYHAAAYKHVPLVEFNPSQGILNNSIGTMVAAQAAIAAKVETFVLVSTDKAVRPTNVMGASKRIAELVLQALDRGHHDTCFTMVRFGNVLDSSGSVIPLFKKQIQAGGPVTVTHSNVVRYFMTITEAVELVIQSGAMAKGGEVFVLDMGEPIRIYDLAVKMIQLSGLVVLDENNPSGDIEIKYTGLRSGEKLYEELLVDGRFSMTKNKLIRRAEEGMIDWDQLEPMLTEIKEASKNVGEYDDNEKLYQLIKKLVPQFNPQANGSDNKDAITADTK
jgi:FlaA1/EpsC-like NDP-sugar epimerase